MIEYYDIENKFANVSCNPYYILSFWQDIVDLVES